MVFMNMLFIFYVIIILDGSTRNSFSTLTSLAVEVGHEQPIVTSSPQPPVHHWFYSPAYFTARARACVCVCVCVRIFVPKFLQIISVSGCVCSWSGSSSEPSVARHCRHKTANDVCLYGRSIPTVECNYTTRLTPYHFTGI